MKTTEEIMELADNYSDSVIGDYLNETHTKYSKSRAVLKSAIEELARDAARWQPIETAPLGGTEIILYGDAFWPTGISPEQCHLYGVVSAGYHSGGIWQMCNRIGKPSHWMPLPDVPKETP